VRPKVVPQPGVLTPSIEEMGDGGAMGSIPSIVPILDRSIKGGETASARQGLKLEPRDDPSAEAAAAGGDGRAAILRSVHEDDDKAGDVIRSGGWVFEEDGARQVSDAKGRVATGGRLPRGLDS
jgi:hypothetical protein